MDRYLPSYILLVLLVWMNCPNALLAQQYKKREFHATIQPAPQVSMLPVRSVHRVFQDTEGYIWYGTVDGLCRDDGYHVQVLRNDYLHSLPFKSNLILSIAEDSLHNILAGTPSGIYLIDKSTYRVSSFHEELFGTQQIQEIYTLHDGTILLSTYDAVYMVDKNGKVTKIASHSATSFLETANHTLLAAFRPHGVMCYDKIKQDWTSLDSVADTLEVNQMTEVGDFIYLCTNKQGILLLIPKENDLQTKYLLQPLPLNVLGKPVCQFYYAKADKEGNHLWATSNDDIHCFDILPNGTLSPVDLIQHLRGYTPQLKMMNELIFSSRGNIWIAGYDRETAVINFEKYNRSRYEVSALEERFFRSTLIISLCQDTDGDSFWLSQERVGLCLYHPERGEMDYYGDYASTKDANLSFIHELIPSKQSHQVWALTAFPYIYGVEYDGNEMKLTHTISLPEQQNAKTIFEAQGGELWIGTYHGIYVYNPLQRKLFPVDGNIGHTTSFTQTPDGTIWAAVTGVGIVEIRDEKIVRVQELHEDILSMASSSDGTLWIGLGNGELLCKSYSGPFVSMSEAAGMNGDMVEKIVVDKYNHLWILTNRALREFDPVSHAYRVIGCARNQSQAVIHLSLTRFMPRAINISIPDGNVAVGGFGGFLVCQPSHDIEGQKRQIQVKVTDLKVSGRSLCFDDALPINSPLPADARNIELFFSSLDFLHASSVRYAYRIDDGEWIYLKEGKNSVQFENIGKGFHELMLKSTDENGVWSDLVTTFVFERQAHWYETTAAYIIYTLFFILALILVVWYFIKRTRKEEEQIWSDSAELLAMRKYVEDSDHIDRPETSSGNVSTSVSDTDNTVLSYTQIDQMLIDKVRQVIIEHIEESDFNVSSLAILMNMSRSTLMRKIKAITGTTPLTLMRDIKMEEAKKMLANKTVSVTEVAQRIGFVDSGYFTQVFKNCFHILPSEYQKQISRMNNSAPLQTEDADK